MTARGGIYGDLHGDGREVMSEFEIDKQAGALKKPQRKHAVATAAYWFRAAREAQEKGDLPTALLYMENAYNHTENTLVALRKEHGLPLTDNS